MSVPQKVSSAPVPASTTATLVGIDALGRALVQHDFCASPVLARSSIRLDPLLSNETRDVLLMFPNNDPQHPVIVGLISEDCRDPRLPGSAAERVLGADDTRVLNLAASDAITLRCGKSQLVLDKFGKIVIKGVNILSRASARNRIKGGSISLN